MVNFLHVKHEMAVILRAETPGGMGGGVIQPPISTKFVSSGTTIGTRRANFWRKEQNTTQCTDCH